MTSEERAALIAAVGRNIPGDFWFFRLQRGPVLYVEEEDRSITAVDLTAAQVDLLPLPTARRIDAKVVLLSSASLFDLASGQASPQPRSRDQWLDVFKELKRISDDPAAARRQLVNYCRRSVSAKMSKSSGTPTRWRSSAVCSKASQRSMRRRTPNWAPR